MVRPSCASGCSAHPTSASTEAQARTNLRHLLHTLRRALPGLDRCLEVTPRTLAWRADSPFWLDVAAFEEDVSELLHTRLIGAFG